MRKDNRRYILLISSVDRHIFLYHFCANNPVQIDRNAIFSIALNPSNASNGGQIYRNSHQALNYHLVSKFLSRDIIFARIFEGARSMYIYIYILDSRRMKEPVIYSVGSLSASN